MTTFGKDLGESLLTRPMTSGLILAAVAVGAASATLLLSLLAGLESSVQARLKSFGSDTVLLTLQDPTGSGVAMTRNHLRLATALQPGLIATGYRSHLLKDPIRGISIQVLSANASLPRILERPLQDGRWLDAQDIEQAQPHALVSAILADAWSLHVGDTLTHPALTVQVVGISDSTLMNPSSPAGTQSSGAWIWIPDTLPTAWMTSPDDPHRFDGLLARISDPDDVRALVRQLQQATGGPAIWTATTADVLVRGERAMMKTVRIAYGSVVLLCLLLGGVALSSLLLVSTRQRRQEIGFRRAIGATQWDIFSLFLAEGIVLTGLGGLIGSGIGALLILFAPPAPALLPLILNAKILLMPITVCLLIGLLFTWQPARTAATLSPADALRVDG